MPKFLIEVSHSSDHEGCVRALHAILAFGSHYTTQADYGCLDGVHKSWLIVEVDSRNIAEGIVPPNFRGDVKVIQLNKFTPQEIQDLVRGLSGEQSS